jgi:uncharacterized protein YacL
MYNKLRISRWLLITALIFGIWLVYASSSFFTINGVWKLIIGIAAFLLFYISLNWIIVFLKKGISSFNQFLDGTSIEILLGGTAGLIIGVLVGVVSGYPISLISGVGNYLTIGIFFFSGYIGLQIGARRAFDVVKLFPANADKKKNIVDGRINYKVIDTSAIIDGRIYDVCLSCFLEGPLIVPTFVIEELQHIADSSDNIRRTKGRRGLELLSKMQKHAKINIDIIEANSYEEKDVDAKLICLCKEINASIVTNDYNLNKVAELQGITVLNFNELANAVKVIVFPGETMHISIIKEGKESGQGVGYLDDGTMVVVEDAYEDIGKDLEVMVTSVFQTAAGRMIFTRKLREESKSSIKDPLRDLQEVNLYG